jgi:hypothetical protein
MLKIRLMCSNSKHVDSFPIKYLMKICTKHTHGSVMVIGPEQKGADNYEVMYVL